MIRRPASLIGSGEAGYVLAGLVQVDASGNETMVMVFEQIAASTGGLPDAGSCTLQPSVNIRFTDGSPAVIAIEE